jgi:hypothetical protein
MVFVEEAINSKQRSAIENLDNDFHAESLFVNRETIARRYDVSPRTVSNWMKDRSLPFYKRGRCARFKISECDAAWEGFKRDSISMKGVNQWKPWFTMPTTNSAA